MLFMYKRIGVLLILITVLLAGCSSSYVSDKEIISDENSYTYRKCNDTGSTSNSLNRAFEGFDGKDTIWMLDVENKASITVKISTTLDKGKFKVLLVTNDNDIVTLLENDGTYEQNIELEAGTSRIIIVGDNSSGVCQIAFSDVENVTIKNTSSKIDFDDWFDDWF